jgi:hypothetical protein
MGDWRAAKETATYSEFHNYPFLLVPGTRIELVQHSVPRDFKSLASTCSATRALVGRVNCGMQPKGFPVPRDGSYSTLHRNCKGLKSRQVGLLSAPTASFQISSVKPTGQWSEPRISSLMNASRIQPLSMMFGVTKK